MNDEPKEMAIMPDSNCINIATISAGFEKGDFLVREEQGNRVYFDFFEEVSVVIFGEPFMVGVLVVSLTDLMCFSVLLTTYQPIYQTRLSTTSPTRGTPAWHERMRSTGLI